MIIIYVRVCTFAYTANHTNYGLISVFEWPLSYFARTQKKVLIKLFIHISAWSVRFAYTHNIDSLPEIRHDQRIECVRTPTKLSISFALVHMEMRFHINYIDRGLGNRAYVQSDMHFPVFRIAMRTTAKLYSYAASSRRSATILKFTRCIVSNVTCHTISIRFPRQASPSQAERTTNSNLAAQNRILWSLASCCCVPSVSQPVRQWMPSARS